MQEKQTNRLSKGLKQTLSMRRLRKEGYRIKTKAPRTAASDY